MHNNYNFLTSARCRATHTFQSVFEFYKIHYILIQSLVDSFSDTIYVFQQNINCRFYCVGFDSGQLKVVLGHKVSVRVDQPIFNTGNSTSIQLWCGIGEYTSYCNDDCGSFTPQFCYDLINEANPKFSCFLQGFKAIVIILLVLLITY